jgi:hypothetical protein
MAKTIKFNLVIDKKPIRDLEDMREHFNIDDALEAYQNGSLKRWLAAREHNSEIAELEKIKGDDIETALELGRIFFGEDYNKDMLAAAAYSFEFRKKEAEKIKQLETAKNQQVEIIRAYHAGYEKLLVELMNKGDDYPFIKAALGRLFSSYLGLFTMNTGAFYYRFIFDYPLVILGVLANSHLRPVLIAAPGINKDDKYLASPDNSQIIFGHLTDPKQALASYCERARANIPQPHLKICTSNDEREEIIEKYEKGLYIFKGEGSSTSIERITQSTSCPFSYIALNTGIYPSHVTNFSGFTEGYWKDVEPKGKKYLIIKMEDRNFVRNIGKANEELKADDVNGKFLILDGIDYKSNNANDPLVYMEI